MAYTLSVILPKGGATKTAIAVNLAAGFARAGWRTLLADVDAQGNASNYVGWTRDARPTMTNVLLDEARGLTAVPAADVLRSTYLDGLHLLPASDGLGPADTVLAGLPGWDRRLMLALEPLQPVYDLIVIDTPPNLSMVTANAAVAADGILLPLTGKVEAWDGLESAVRKLDEWRRFTGAAMPILGVVRSGWDLRRKLDRAIQGRISGASMLEGLVLEQIIPEQTVVAQAYHAARDVAAFAPGSDAAEAFTRLVQEVGTRIASTSDVALGTGTPGGGA